MIRKSKRTDAKAKEHRPPEHLEPARRRERCRQSESLLTGKGAKEAPGDRGACEQESSSQGSE